MSSTVLKGLAIGGALCAAEHFLAPKPLSDGLVPKAIGLVVVINGVATTFQLIGLGFSVGRARKQYGVSLPRMYAEGDGDDARAFNCVQRAHQHALETYPSFAMLSVFGASKFPLTTALGGVMWLVGRRAFAAGYSSGDPDKRYASSTSRLVWYSLLTVMAASLGTSIVALKIKLPPRLQYQYY